MNVKRKAGTRPHKKVTRFICIIFTVMLIMGCANRGGLKEDAADFLPPDRRLMSQKPPKRQKIR